MEQYSQVSFQKNKFQIWVGKSQMKK